jgi:hypothetical protein
MAQQPVVPPVVPQPDTGTTHSQTPGAPGKGAPVGPTKPGPTTPPTHSTPKGK